MFLPGTSTTNPACLVKMDSRDSSRVRAVMDSSALGWLRPLSSISDTTTRRICQEAYEAWQYAWNNLNTVVWKGATTDTLPDGTPTHDGQGAFNTAIHFDPHALNDITQRGKQALAEVALHEAIHYYYGPAVNQATHVWPYTGEAWFENIHSRDPVKGCVK